MLRAAFLPPLIGGALIGLSATWLLASIGRIAGISGIVGTLLQKPEWSQSWRVGFVVGLLAVGWALLGPRYLSGVAPPLPTLVVAGLLVGFGTRLGSGCTSGHGVCGLSWLSRRSLVATLVFMGTAMLVVFITRHVLSGIGP